MGVVCGDLVRKFGGLDAFYAAWQRCLDEDLKAGGFAAIRHLEAVLRLAQYCDRRSRRAVRMMTDAELEAALAAHQPSLTRSPQPPP